MSEKFVLLVIVTVSACIFAYWSYKYPNNFVVIGMSEKRFTLTDWHEVKDNGKIMTVDEVVGKLNEQQATINILLEELVNAQQQGYVIGFLHKNEPCSLIPKELENE